MNILNSISFVNVNFSFGKRLVISGFSESISSGEHVCIMGESGAGKSTLLNSIVGLTFPDSGLIKVADLVVNARNIWEIRRMVAWLPQDVMLPYQTVIEMMNAPFELAVNRHILFDEDRCLDLLLQIGLDGSILNKNISAISGGEKQRLLLVLSLMLERRVLLLDEPTSALDSVSRDKLIALLSGLTDKTILSITHDLEFANSMGRIITIKRQ